MHNDSVKKAEGIPANAGTYTPQYITPFLLKLLKWRLVYEPLTAKIHAERSMLEKDRDLEAMRNFAYELGLALKKHGA
jgi:hypothetical protein